MYVPKQNVESVMADIKCPAFNYAASARRHTIDLRALSRGVRKDRTRLARTLGLATGALLLLGGLFAVRAVANVRTFLSQKENVITEQLRSSVAAMKKLDMQDARQSLTDSLSNLQEVHSVIGAGTGIFKEMASVIPFVRNVGEFMSRLTAFNKTLIGLSGSIEELQVNGVQDFLHDGGALVGKLASLETSIGNVLTGADALKNSASGLRSVSGFGGLEQTMQDYYLSYSSQLYGTRAFVGGLRALLASPEERQLLILFQNDSELRPAGGFLGSYGVLTVKNGQMERLEVQDIYWPDSPLNLERKLIPPKALQHMTTDWGARDANWFFNFPDSAEAVLSLLESSKIYAASSTEFIGALAINTKVLETLIGAVGELRLEKYDMTLTKDNFLEELQREVETGPDKQPGKNPKRILSVLAPMLMERLETLPSEETKSLLETLGAHVANKDIMFYFRDKTIRNTLADYGIDGSVYAAPAGSWGSYLAVVNANVAGGKSDAVVRQDVNMWIDVGVDGSSVGDVTVQRTHNGGDRQDAWYRADNKDYLNVFVNEGAELLSMRGNTVRRDADEVYGKEYATYPLLASIEATRIYMPEEGAWSMNESGKEVFSSWLITKKGETKSLNVRYRNPAVGGFTLAPGNVFRFVFDKQSGSETTLAVHISAPVGYIWKEAGAPVYAADFASVSKRETINLTLEKKE